jgi:hypothetical protein
MSHLTSEQRYTISVLLEQNFSKQIAIVIKRQVRFNTRATTCVIYAVVNMILI